MQKDNEELPPKTWWLCKETINGFHKKPSVILRPCPLEYDDVISSLEHKVIPLYGARYVAAENETAEQFEIRLAATDGIAADFVLDDEYDDFVSHVCIKSILVDCHTGKTLYNYAKK